MLKTVALAKFIKTENLTENVLELYVWSLMPFQPRSNANFHTFSFRILEYFWFLKTSLVLQFLNTQSFRIY